MATKKQLLLIEVELEEIDTLIVPQEFKDAIFERLLPEVVNVRVAEISYVHLRHDIDSLMPNN